MGVELQRVVDYVTQRSTGLAAVDLARLNLRTGAPLSRAAARIADDPKLVELAWRVAVELVGGEGRHGAETK